MHVAMDVQCFNSVQKEFVSVMDELETSSVHPCNASKLVVSKLNFVVNYTVVAKYSVHYKRRKHTPSTVDCKMTVSIE